MFIVASICAYKSINHSIDMMTLFEVLIAFTCFQLGLEYIKEIANDEDILRKTKRRSVSGQ